MEQQLQLTKELLQKNTQDVYTWFESLTPEETVLVCKNFVEQVNTNPEYAFANFANNIFAELSKTKNDEEIFTFINEGTDTITQQIESHPLYNNTKLAFIYFYKGIIAFYNQYPKNENIQAIAKNFFSLQCCAGVMEKGHWSDTDILKGVKFS
jgi:hypothetical protein